MATVPRLPQYYEGATTAEPASLGLIVFAVRYRACLLFRAVAEALLMPTGRHQAGIGPEAGSSPPTVSHTDVFGPPRFPGKPSCGFAIVPATPAGPSRLVLTALPVLPPPFEA